MNSKYPIIVIILGLLFSGAIILSNPGQRGVRTLSSEEAKKTTEEFINRELLQGQAKASLSEVSEESGLYKIPVSIQGQTFLSYISKDGKIFFTEGFDVENFEAPTGGGIGMVGGC